MDPLHRDRLRAAGVEASSLDAVAWTPAPELFPAWWSDQGNVLYLADGAGLPDKVLADLAAYPVHDVLIAVGSPHPNLGRLLVGGDRATVFLDRDVVLTAGEIYCGADSQIVLHGPVTATREAAIDARNGGSIIAQADQLWAAHVQIVTDDMHRLADARTGARINPYGAHIRLGRHVWLARDVMVTGHADIGDGAVVGVRSVVRGQKIPERAAVAGVPARVIREDIEWSEDDLP